MIKNDKDNFLKPPNILETDLLDESNVNLGRESEGFCVYSDLKFMYQIGKICAESNKYLEEGLLCLDDLLSISNSFSTNSVPYNRK
jgi:hypothetical protein